MANYDDIFNASAQKSKDEPNRASEHRPVPKKKKGKER